MLLGLNLNFFQITILLHVIYLLIDFDRSISLIIFFLKKVDWPHCPRMALHCFCIGWQLGFCDSTIVFPLKFFFINSILYRCLYNIVQSLILVLRVFVVFLCFSFIPFYYQLLELGLFSKILVERSSKSFFQVKVFSFYIHFDHCFNLSSLFLLLRAVLYTWLNTL